MEMTPILPPERQGLYDPTSEHDACGVGFVVEQAPPQPVVETVVVAPGTSCRHQIHDFTGETATHPAVLLRSLLTDRTPA